MSIKHNFTAMMDFDNPLVGVFSMINDATNHIFWYALLILIFTVSVYVYMRKTQDTGKSFVMGLHVITITGIIIYYLGLSIGKVFLPNIIILGIVMIEILSLGGIIYARRDQV